MAVISAGARRRGQTAEKYLPLGYFAMALLLALAMLPSVLRQSPPTTNESAELSPDAPPDPNQQSFIASFNRGVSGTAGSGTGLGGHDEAAGSPTAPNVPRACRYGYGNPPRTTSSPYAAPCVTKWSGNNGGATSKGVTGTEIRVAVGNPNGDAGTDGPVPTTPRDNESAVDRTWRVLQAWFNSRYEFYGRTLRFYVQNYDETPAKQAAAAQTVDEQYHVFAASMGRWATMTELARRGIIAFAEDGDQYPESFLASHRPYNWEMNVDADRAVRLSAEYICKKMWGKKAEFAGDAATQAKQRVLGVLYNDNTGYSGIDKKFKSELQSQCGGTVEVTIGFAGDTYGWSDPQQVATAVTKLRQHNVTTVVQLLDMDTMGLVTNQADSQGYNPEWFISGLWETDNVTFARLQNTRQWSHAFGLSGREIDNSASQEPGYRAYKEIDPNNEPDSNMVCCLWWGLEQIANGIQMAGPNLTPQSFERGLVRQGKRGSDPIWAVTGGFGPDDYSYSDAMAEIWWNPNTQSADGQPGAYMYVRNGKRFNPGELPKEEPLVFKQGTNSGDLRRQG
jgi:hypothetical protein